MERRRRLELLRPADDGSRCGMVRYSGIRRGNDVVGVYLVIELPFDPPCDKSKPPMFGCSLSFLTIIFFVVFIHTKRKALAANMVAQDKPVEVEFCTLGMFIIGMVYFVAQSGM